jgi:hypothetical protein
MRNEPGGHDVVEVDELDKGVHLGAEGNLFLGHLLRHLLGGTSEPSDEGMAVVARLLAAQTSVGAFKHRRQAV